MERINSQPLDFQKLAMQALSWLVCARERLTLTELQHALGVEVSSSALDEENLPDIECLISSCAGLVALDEHSHVIRLVHYTTQQYFEQTWTDWFPNAHAEIAQTCVTYLNFDVFDSGSCKTDNEFDIRLEKNPLYKYAALSWDFHARLQPVDEVLLHNFLKDDGKVTACFEVLRSFRPGTPLPEDEASSRTSGLHLAAFLGIIPGFERLLIDADPNAENGEGETPLKLAIFGGHKGVVKLLRARGAAIDPEDKWGETPLFHAITKCDVKMVRYLLDDGADPDVSNYDGETLFSHAIMGRNEEIFKLLFQKRGGLQVGPGVRRCLEIAAAVGSTGIVQLLLDAGVDATYSDDAPSILEGGIRYAPLCRAAKHGYEAIFMLLLDRTAENDIAQRINKVALSLSAQSGHDRIVKLLIQRGVDPDSKEHWGWTPLLLAVSHGKAGTVNALLENGASPDIGVSCRELDPLLSFCSKDLWNAALIKVIEGFRDRSVDMTPLALAAKRGNRDICRHLLLYAAATVQGKKRQLLWACHGGHEMVVEVLLEEGAHADCCDQTGRTPLSIAAELGHEAIARRLLEKDAMPGSKDISGQTPLSYALENDHREVFYLLGKKHPHILLSRDIFGRSPLFLSAGIDDSHLHRFILEATSENESFGETVRRDLTYVEESISDMDTDLLRAFGGNCLLWAVRNDHCQIASRLLLKGVDPNCTDRDGSTALAVAAKENNEVLAKVLLDSGANPNLRDRFRRTPLSWAIFYQSEKLVLLLLHHSVDLSMRIPGLWRQQVPDRLSYELEEVWDEGKTPLELAVYRGNENVIAIFARYTVWSSEDYEAALLQAVRSKEVFAIEILLERNFGEHAIHSALREAILDKHKDTVKVLLDVGLGQQYILNETGITLMFLAARNGLNNVVRFMLDKGANCNCRLPVDINSLTAPCESSLLLIAAQKGHEAIVDLLLKHGADPWLKNNWGNYPLRAAMESGHHNVAQILSEKGAKLGSKEEVEECLIQAAKDGNLLVVEKLLDEAAGANTKGSALWLAAHNNREAVAGTLLTAQADPDYRLPEEEWMPVTSQFIEIKRRRVASARARRVGGADPDIPGRNGRTALSLAAEKGRQPLIEVLLNHHANLADEHNRTPLFFATMNGNEAAVRTLLNYGSAAAHSPTSAQRTASSVAREFGWQRIAVLLSGHEQAAQSATPDASEINCATLCCDNCCCEIRDLNSPLRCPSCSHPFSRDSFACNEFLGHRKVGCFSFECSNCFCYIHDSDFHFHCPICSDLDGYCFDVCIECFHGGFRCYDKLHALQKRTLKNGEIEIQRIIRPWSTHDE